MQELNEAYGVLGNEENRRRYDSGVSENQFTNEGDFNYKDYFEAERARANAEYEEATNKLKSMCRCEVILWIRSNILSNGSGVGNFSTHLDSNLWSPYEEWGEKVLSIEIKDDDIDERGLLKVNSELAIFQEKMIDHIKKVADEFRKGIRIDPYVTEQKNRAIELIEKLLKDKGLTVKDLGKYANYQAQLNEAVEIWDIEALRNKIKRYICSLKNKNNSQNSEQSSRQEQNTLDKKGYENKEWELIEGTKEKIKLGKEMIETINPNSNNNNNWGIAVGAVGAVVIAKKRRRNSF